MVIILIVTFFFYFSTMKIIFSSSLFFLLLHSPFSLNDFVTYSQPLPSSTLEIDMTPVYGGKFIMGDDSFDALKHEIEVSSFWISTYEISWDVYTLFMERNIDELPSSFKKGSEVFIDVDGVSSATTPYMEMSFGMGTNGYPAINMTQFAASKFCEWLSSITGNYYRLPTEAEWEYACKAGSNSDYHFGDDSSKLGEYAWYSDNSNGSYHRIGTKKPNALGLYDMHGNVSEWTIDTYSVDKYKNRNTLKNPFYITKNKYPKVIRGGSWNDDATRLKSSRRDLSTKELQKRDPQIPKSKWWNTDAPYIGFRIVRPLSTPEDDVKNLFWNY